MFSVPSVVSITAQWVNRGRKALFEGYSGRTCTKVSPIESLLQYRYATPTPLKVRPWLECCITARDCVQPLEAVGTSQFTRVGTVCREH